MNRFRTLTEIVNERFASRAPFVNDADYIHATELRMMNRMNNDPALGMVVGIFADSLTQVLANYPQDTHREFVKQCLVQAIMEWENANAEFNEQLKRSPIT